MLINHQRLSSEFVTLRESQGKLLPERSERRDARGLLRRSAAGQPPRERKVERFVIVRHLGARGVVGRQWKGGGRRVGRRRGGRRRERRRREGRRREGGGGKAADGGQRRADGGGRATEDGRRREGGGGNGVDDEENETEEVDEHINEGAVFNRAPLPHRPSPGELAARVLRRYVRRVPPAEASLHRASSPAPASPRQRKSPTANGGRVSRRAAC